MHTLGLYIPYPLPLSSRATDPGISREVGHEFPRETHTRRGTHVAVLLMAGGEVAVQEQLFTACCNEQGSAEEGRGIAGQREAEVLCRSAIAVHTGGYSLHSTRSSRPLNRSGLAGEVGARNYFAPAI